MLIEKSNGGCDPVFCGNGLISEKDLRYLKSRNLIRMEPAGDNEFFAIVSDDGISYFSSKQERRVARITEHFLHFAGGFISGVLVTVVAQLLIH